MEFQATRRKEILILLDKFRVKSNLSYPAICLPDIATTVHH